MNWEKSCGALVYTVRDGQPLFVIVQEMAGAYSFPKGHMEAGETEMETACREIWEEIRLRPKFVDGFRITDEYDLKEKPGTRKQIVYFLAEYGDEVLTPLEGEIRRVLLVPREEVHQYLDNESTRKMFDAACDYLMEYLRTR